MYQPHASCRACGYGLKLTPPGIKSAKENQRLVEVLDMGVQPLANDFCKPDQERQGQAPLKVLVCPKCLLGQLSVTVSPDILYANHYPYVTSRSQTMQRHFQSLWQEMVAPGIPKTLMEIGSNDGYFMEFCREQGVESVVGIDPASNLAAVANQNNLPTVCADFSEGSAADALLLLASKPDVIMARHVFAHIDDWKRFVRGLEYAMKRETVVMIEVPYVGDLISGIEFDTIYHEHLSYVSISAVKELLRGSGIHLHKIIRFPIHGGAIVLVLKSNAAVGETDPSVAAFPLDPSLKDWERFAVSVREKIIGLKNFARYAAHSLRLCGLGASAKSTVWINACGFSSKEISFICDSTPAKQHTLSPGSDIPIVDEGALLRELPDYCINFAWNFHQEVLSKNQLFIKNGGKIISPHSLA